MCVIMAPTAASRPTPASGPLRVSRTNSRYFEDGDGRVVYLTGSHTWANMKDMGTADPPTPFDFEAYLDQLEAWNHNFIRLWTWELARYTYAEGAILYAAPFPWERTGPALALDGKPRFDLTRFNDAYFRRLRDRVAAAGNRGLYVSVMLFEGHGVQQSLPPWCWDGHPFHAANNVNGVDGDPDGDGRGTETHTLAVPAVTAVQEAYVRKVVDVVNDLDNVLYEIVNEAGPYSTEWQYHMIRLVKAYEATQPKQHPVGMTFQYAGGSNRALFDSPADWVSPNPEGGYRDAPPPADGSKAIVSDTDHLWGIGGNAAWVWKTFLSGMHPIYMDPFDTQGFRSLPSVRASMGHTLAYARRVGLAHMVPRPDLSSSAYCLAAPGREYLVFVPAGSAVDMRLGDASGAFRVEWCGVDDGATLSSGHVEGGGVASFRGPFAGDAVLYLFR
jgi:hypothetical protein